MIEVLIGKPFLPNVVAGFVQLDTHLQSIWKG